MIAALSGITAAAVGCESEVVEEGGSGGSGGTPRACLDYAPLGGMGGEPQVCLEVSIGGMGGEGGAGGGAGSQPCLVPPRGGGGTGG